MRLSRFNEKGVREFQKLLESARQGQSLETPLQSITDPECTEEIPGVQEFDVDVFDTRRDLASYVDALLSDAADS